MILSETVLVKISGSNMKHYESLGYNIPRQFDKHNNRMLIKRGTSIEISVKHLLHKSHTKVLVRCDNNKCNRENLVDYQKLKKSGEYFCHTCAINLPEYRKKLRENSFHKNKFGSDNPNYDITITKKERYTNRHRNLVTGYNKWRKEILKRDNYVCQFPGCKCMDKLRVHHINSWNKFPNQRVQINNGITLCEKHHKQIHHIFGLETTVSDYEKFQTLII